MHVIKMVAAKGAVYYFNKAQQWSKDRTKAENFPTEHVAKLRKDRLTSHLSEDEKKSFTVEPLKVF